MSLTPIDNTTTITANGYNAIRDTINNILTDYGRNSTNVSASVTSGNNISHSDWLNLLTDYQIIYTHQNNSNFQINATAPAAGGIISSNWIAPLVDSIIVADNNKYLRPPAGQRMSDATTKSTYTGAGWGSGTFIHHTATFNWVDGTSLGTFFKLGGQIGFSITYPSGTYTNNNAVLARLIDSHTSDLSTLVYNYSNYVVGGTVTLASWISGDLNIQISATLSDASLSVTTKFNNAGVTTTLQVSNTFIYEHSAGAILAPIPQVTVLSSDTLGYAVVVPSIHKTLSVSTPSAYAMISQQVSSLQTITISNIGNATISVSGITFSNTHGGVLAETDFSGLGGSTSFTLNPGTFKTFTLSYSGSQAGTFNNSFTVNSDNDAGSITISTTQIVSAFGFSITPTSDITYRYPDTGPFNPGSQKYTIVASDGQSYNYTYTSVLTTGGEYSVSNSDHTGPTVTFTPPSPYAPGTYTSILTVYVTLNGITYTTNSIHYNITLPPIINQNLGTWLSGLYVYDAVVGMSYDIIQNARYITIGIGVTPDLENGGQQILDVNELIGANADSINYGHWTEVYRIAIPANGSAQTFYTTISIDQYNNLVHSSGPVFGNVWGNFFSLDGKSRTMFSITDDGTGNLHIVLGTPTNTGDNGTSVTTDNLGHILAYYTEGYRTYSQLDSQPYDGPGGSKTRLFTGFDSTGAVQTTIIDPFPMVNGGG